MCIICLELEKSFDIPDIRRMIAGARSEPGSIPEEHLKEIEKKIDNIWVRLHLRIVNLFMSQKSLQPYTSMTTKLKKRTVINNYFDSENEFKEWLNSDDESYDEYDEVKVEGGVRLYDGDKLKNLPKNLRVGGRLSLKGCRSLTNLPEGLKVGGWLDLRRCFSLETLPEGLKVEASLWLEGCTSLSSMPEGLEVEGSLNLRHCTSLASLPKGLKVGGNLYVDGSGVADVKSHPGVKGKIVH